MQISEQMRITLDIKHMSTYQFKKSYERQNFSLNRNINDKELIKHILHMLQTIMKQNYFH